MSLAWREFRKAMTHLSGPGTQRERLALACGPALLGMKRKEIPREARGEFDALIHLIGADWTRDAASTAEMVHRLSDVEVAQAAAKMLSIYDQLTRYQPTRTAFGDMQAQPPATLAKNPPDRPKNDDAQTSADKEKARC